MREYCLGSELFNSLVEKRHFECSGLCLVSLVLNPVGTVTGGGEFLHVVVFEFGSIARGVFSLSLPWHLQGYGVTGFSHVVEGCFWCSAVDLVVDLLLMDRRPGRIADHSALAGTSGLGNSSPLLHWGLH